MRICSAAPRRAVLASALPAEDPMRMAEVSPFGRTNAARPGVSAAIGLMKEAFTLLEAEGELLALARLQHAIDTLVCQPGAGPVPEAVQRSLEQTLADTMMEPIRRQ